MQYFFIGKEQTKHSMESLISKQKSQCSTYVGKTYKQNQLERFITQSKRYLHTRAKSRQGQLVWFIRKSECNKNLGTKS